MSPEQEHIIALASVVKKLKDKNLKPSKRFKTSSPDKGKGKGKGKGQKQATKQSQYVKGKKYWKRNIQKTEKQTPRKSTTRLTFGAQLIRLGPFITQKNLKSIRKKPSPPISKIISTLTPSLWPELWPPYYPRSTVTRMGKTQPAVVDTGLGWAFSRLTSSLSVNSCCRYSSQQMNSTSSP